ncbi:hypothetical protein BE08_04980 [Sorangium cellulosum]|uniref:Uncharacterized protein n=1 Tax=Sorangium cellulosum TaxID=56 RepID=A0A150PJH0_SORCE|nr:hypothetical protein BE08_04980 [Sorangium cellulosum]
MAQDDSGETKTGTATTVTAARVVDRGRIQVEFVIDDLVKQLVKDRVSPVAACNGCNACSASLEKNVLPTKTGK